MNKLLSLQVLSSLTILLGMVGCASTGSQMTVDMASTIPQSSSAVPAVTVQDSRAPGVSSHREAAFGMSMGNVHFNPSETELVKATVQNTLADLVAAGKIDAPKHVSCDLTRFGVYTQTTAMYWDVKGAVAFSLNIDGKKLAVEGMGTDRTYVWPGEEIFRKVANAALSDAASKIKNQLNK
jgi:hypothetical protein